MNGVSIISGCQRSGTTLLSLILSVHPHCTSVDEDVYDAQAHGHYLRSDDYSPSTVLKLPAQSHRLVELDQRLGGGVRLLWCERDALDVALSMQRLELPYRLGYRHILRLWSMPGKVTSYLPPLLSIPWIHHPYGGIIEAEHVRSSLDPGRVQTIDRLEQSHRPEGGDRGVWSALTLWIMKAHLKVQLQRHFTSRMHDISYEQLIREPENSLREIAAHLGIDYDPIMLEHHRHRSGTSIGHTARAQPIDPGNHHKYETVWSEDDIIRYRAYILAAIDL